MRIDTILARSILDTRGRATIETTIIFGEHSATASVPSGKSTGSHEALELRDTDGSVNTAIANVNGEIAKAITGIEFAQPEDLDRFLIELDSTPGKSRLGANAILSVSIAATRLFAQTEGVALWHSIAKRAGTTPSAPRLYVNVMNGGVHADFKLPFQEYILVCEGKTSNALRVAQEIFTKLGEKLGPATPMGDEGGYAPTFTELEEPFQILTDLTRGNSNTFIAIDAAASEFYHDGAYTLLDKQYSAQELSEVYIGLVDKFPLKSIEDPFDEESRDDFTHLTKELLTKTIVVGDDLTVTDPARVKDALERKEINVVLIKPNQIGTVTEAINAVKETYKAGCKIIASHRSGETLDTFIADFAYGVGAYGIKAGGLGQAERVEKYERLLVIEKEVESV